MTSSEVKDVIVVGGGVFGLCAAYSCALKGLNVRLIDRAKTGAGASGGFVGAMSPHTPDEWNPKKQFQYDALVSAQAFWMSVEARSDLSSGYGRVGRLTPNMTARVQDLSEKRAVSAPKFWAPEYQWTLLKSHDLIANDYAEFGLVYDTFSARIHPQMACASLRKACLDLGVEITQGLLVTDVSDHKITCGGGVYGADAIILAGGADGFGLMDDLYGVTTGTGVKGQSALLDLSLRDAPTIAGEGLYIVPHANGTVGVGSTSEVAFDDPYSTDDKLDVVLAKARALCPALVHAPVIARWANQRPKAKKRTPIVGKLPNVKGLYVAGGGFKIGFGIAHKIGQMVADTLTETPVDIPPTFLPEHHLSA